PAMKGANHQLRRMDQIVIHMMNLTRSESRGPMCLFQLAFQAGLVGGDRSASKEAVPEKTGQNRSGLQVLDRLSLGVQDGLYALDDIFAMRYKKPQQVDMCLKGDLIRRHPRHDTPCTRFTPIRERV